MKERAWATRANLRGAVRQVTKTLPSTGKSGIVTVLCLAAAMLLALCLWPSHGPMKFPAHVQGAASGGTFTSFDVSEAGTSAYQGTIGVSIDAAGDVAGIYLDSSMLAHGFLRTANSTITPFDAPDAGKGLTEGTFPVSINVNGDIAGVYFDTNKAYHGFVRIAAGGAITEFDVPAAPTNIGHRGTIATSIDDAGNISGFYKDTNNVRHGFLRATGGTFTTFDVSSAGTAEQEGTQGPLAINAGGIIAGNYEDSTMERHGFVRTTDGTITTFDAPGAARYTGGVKDICCGGTLPMAIDAGGDIAGGYTDSNGVAHGFVRVAAGTSTSFDAPNAGTSGTAPVPSGTFATSINTSGVITGVYSDTNGVAHGFLRGATGTITSFDAPNAGTSGIAPIPSGTYAMSINDSGVIAGAYSDPSGVVHGFVYTPGEAQVATPTFSPAAGTYSTTQTVSISDATPAATIYYTTDGSTPTTSSPVYSTALTVSATETISAMATATGYANSAVATATYTISAPLAATPTISPAGGNFTSTQSVTIADTTQGATIYYTTNGTMPTTSSTVYSAPISVSSTETIEAIAVASGFSDSTVASATYTFPVDFQLSVTPSSLTIVDGQTGQAVFTVTPENGFNSAVSFACSGLPALASCSFKPSSVTPNGGPISSTLTISTTSSSGMLASPENLPARSMYAVILPGLLMLFGMAPRRRTKQRALQLLCAIVLLGAVAGLTSCGSGSKHGTPLGTDTVSITASATGASHSAALTVTIKQP